VQGTELPIPWLKMMYQIEHLEGRRLLAGDVIAAVVAGNLVVRGDGFDNAIIVDGEGLAAGQVRLSGTDGTSINGSGEPLLLEGITHDVRVIMPGGRSSVMVRDVQVGRDLGIRTGDGDDTILIQRVEVGGYLHVATFAGGDGITIEDAAVGGRGGLFSGGGSDWVRVEGSRFGSHLILRTGAGNDGQDWVVLRRTSIGGNLHLATYGGDDRIHLLGVEVEGRAGVFAGSGRDDVAVELSRFGGFVLVRGGPGADGIRLYESDFEGGHWIEPVRGNQITHGPLTLTFDFGNRDEGWEAGFADYRNDPVLIEILRLESDLRPLPEELDIDGSGFYLGGQNSSDDLFMFLKRQLSTADGIVPYQSYVGEFEISFASNAPSGCIGAGGPPGEGVRLQAGGGAVEPQLFIDKINADDWVRVNVIRGDSDDAYASNAGDIANGLPCKEALDAGKPYILIQRHHVHKAPIAADASGTLWLLVGTDSGFEGHTGIYYQRITVAFHPQR
jgi:hypothetical protein